MTSSIKLFTYILAGIFFLRVAGPCNCKRELCESSPKGVTSWLGFEVQNKTTGQSLLTYTGAVQAAPDSIKLKNLVTGVYYPLFITVSPVKPILYTGTYNRPSGVTDSLVFYFGTAMPDTLIVNVGIVDGWRGDECGTVKEPGITKVMLRGQVLLETTIDYMPFVIKK